MMFAYSRSAIDFWPGWMTEIEYKVHLTRAFSTGNDAANAFRRYERFRDDAFELAKKVGWEGDVREGPFIAGLPCEEGETTGLFMVAWKQDNNGDAFIVSPLRLPWLESADYGRWISG